MLKIFMHTIALGLELTKADKSKGVIKALEVKGLISKRVIIN
jgi:hypothetical protein